MDEPDNDETRAVVDENLVSIFKTGDPALLPLATMALDGEDIEYTVRNAGKVDSLRWMMSQSPTNRPTVTEIMVASDVAARARDLVIDLEQQSLPVSPADPGTLLDGTDPPRIQVEDTATGISIGTISEGELQQLTSHLEEHEQAQQYLINQDAIDTLTAADADATLVDLLRHALGDRDELLIRWVVR